MKRGGTLLFLKEGLKHYRECGTLFPSSPRLAKAIVNALPALKHDDVIVELGAGTGVVTKQLVDKYPKHRIISIEINAEFVKKLRTEYPSVEIIESCASKIEDVLKKLGIPHSKVGAFVSGIPFISIPEEIKPKIWGAMANVLDHGKAYIQFSYIAAYWTKGRVPGFERDRKKRVWTNIPPAYVFTFKRVVSSPAEGKKLTSSHSR